MGRIIKWTLLIVLAIILSPILVIAFGAISSILLANLRLILIVVPIIWVVAFVVMKKGS